MINSYNIMPEVVCLLLSLLVLFCMYNTMPRISKIYAVNFAGIILSISAVSINIFLAHLNGRLTPDLELLYDVFYFIYLSIYIVILYMIYIYIIYLTAKQLNHIEKWNKLYIFIISAYEILMFYLLISNQLYTFDNGSIVIGRFYYIHLIFGIFDALACLAVSMINVKRIPKSIYYFLMSFIPLDIFLLSLQLSVNNIYFTSITYVFPFVTFYILFHSNPFDEISGAQNNDSFETRFRHLTAVHKTFYVTNIIFPSLEIRSPEYTDADIQYIISATSRNVEHLLNKIHIYRQNDYSFNIIFSAKNIEMAEEIINKISTELSRPVLLDNYTYKIRFHMYTVKCGKEINSVNTFHSIQHYIKENIEFDESNRSYICTPEDYVQFKSYLDVEKALRSIKFDKDINDPRVLCYAQPIFDVKSNSFRTAEALVRLKLNDTIIYPDKFIRIAEDIGCMRIINYIMLNKVCKTIKDFNNEYDFDVITINYSAIDFSDNSIIENIIKIINYNEISAGKINIELTENSLVEDYEPIVNNMKRLNQLGVRFYLDDFGTGYSNLERILLCPFKTIKFDKSLLYKAVEDHNVDEIVEGLAASFKKQGFILLIEGVEDDIQNDYCIERGFDYIQGYKYARPLPIDRLTEYFKSIL